jgi:hypothetical protein
LIQRASVACLVMALCVLQGCANVSPTLAHEATADQSAGYVALQSTHNTGVGMAFELTNVKTNQKYGLPLTNSAHSDATAEVVAIKMPPGNYRLTQWMAYGWLTPGLIGHQDVTWPAFKEAFSVGAGQVNVLGGFLAKTSDTPRLQMSVTPSELTADEVKRSLSMAYPGLKGMPISCITCTSD